MNGFEIESPNYTANVGVALKILKRSEVFPKSYRDCRLHKQTRKQMENAFFFVGKVKHVPGPPFD